MVSLMEGIRKCVYMGKTKIALILTISVTMFWLTSTILLCLTQRQEYNGEKFHALVLQPKGWEKLYMEISLKGNQN